MKFSYLFVIMLLLMSTVGFSEVIAVSKSANYPALKEQSTFKSAYFSANIPKDWNAEVTIDYIINITDQSPGVPDTHGIRVVTRSHVHRTFEEQIAISSRVPGSNARFEMVGGRKWVRSENLEESNSVKVKNWQAITIDGDNLYLIFAFAPLTDEKAFSGSVQYLLEHIHFNSVNDKKNGSSVVDLKEVVGPVQLRSPFFTIDLPKMWRGRQQVEYVRLWSSPEPTHKTKKYILMTFVPKKISFEEAKAPYGVTSQIRNLVSLNTVKWGSKTWLIQEQTETTAEGIPLKDWSGFTLVEGGELSFTGTALFEESSSFWEKLQLILKSIQ